MVNDYDIEEIIWKDIIDMNIESEMGLQDLLTLYEIDKINSELVEYINENYLDILQSIRDMVYNKNN